MYAAELNWLIVFDQMLIVPPENSLPDGVMPRPSLEVTIEWVAKVECRNPGAAR
jgi:hypothetical protein